MSHFTRIREIGLWVIGVLWPSELEQFDANQAAAVNGDGGGAWNPTTPIILGGAGLQIATSSTLSCVGSLVCSGPLTTTGTATLASLTVSGSATMGSALVSGNCAIGTTGSNLCYVYANLIVLNDSTIGVNGTDTCTVNSTLLVKNDATIGETSADRCTVNSTTDFNSGVTLRNTALGLSAGTTGDTISLEGDLVFNNGRFIGSTTFVPDGDHASTYRYRFFYTTVTAARALNVTVANPRKGTEFHVHSQGAFGVLVNVNGGTPGSVTASVRNLLVVFDGTLWQGINY